MMNNKQSGYVGNNDGRNSPSPTPSTLCFSHSRRNNGNNNGNVDKKQQQQHTRYHDSCQNIGLCGCRRTSKSRCVSAIGK